MRDERCLESRKIISDGLTRKNVGSKKVHGVGLPTSFCDQPDSPMKGTNLQPTNVLAVYPAGCLFKRMIDCPFKSPTGHTSLPRGVSWSNKSKGILGRAAETIIASNGLLCLSPIFFSASRSDILVIPSFSILFRDSASNSGILSTPTTSLHSLERMAHT